MRSPALVNNRPGRFPGLFFAVVTITAAPTHLLNMFSSTAAVKGENPRSNWGRIRRIKMEHINEVD